MDKRLIIGMSGASGAPLTLELLRQLHDLHPEIETHFVMTHGAALTLQQECGLSPEELRPLVSVWHACDAIGASIASGSFPTMGMIVVPCSMKTVAGIHSGYSDNLLLRAADVCLKERRPLLLAARESPLSAIHLRNLYELSLMGVQIVPPMLSYYSSPGSVEDCTRAVVARLLSPFLQDTGGFRWEGLQQ